MKVTQGQRIRTEHGSWLELWKSPRLGFQAGLTIVLMAVVLAAFSRFLEYVEARPGVVIVDPVLQILPARDVTWWTFSFIYSSLFIALVPLIRRPDKFLIAAQSYTLMILLRGVAMYLLPLEAPPGIIALKDPFVEYFVGDGGILTKDLFFSGHTSTMFLLFLTATSTRFRYVFLAFTVLVGFCVLWQHVHYSVDVLAAPFFAYGSVRIAVLIDRFINRRHRRPQP
jgi:membrane-associated phospholipid phosphatase